MLIRLIEEKSEEHFLETLEESSKKSVSRSVLLCRLSRIPLIITPDDILPFLKDLLVDRKGELYFCKDGDLAICWVGKTKEIRQEIVEQFKARYPLQIDTAKLESLFAVYDTTVHGEDLRLIFREKLHKRQNEDGLLAKPAEPEKKGWEPEFTEEQQALLMKAIFNRAARKGIKILIVEDQRFSRKLLSGLLERTFYCFEAENGEQAVRLYAEHAPNIVFLDIELPDASGHELAALFKKYDIGSYVIMVTGNNYAKDVAMAKKNKVQGFIVKPYQKQRILSVIEAYKSKRGKS